MARDTMADAYERVPTLMKPVVVYGSEAWPLSQTYMIILNVWERDILRRVYGPFMENEYWRIRSNNELQVLYRDLDIR